MRRRSASAVSALASKMSPGWIIGGFLLFVPFYWRSTVPVFGIASLVPLSFSADFRKLSPCVKLWLLTFIALSTMSIPVAMSYGYPEDGLVSNGKLVYYTVFLLLGACAGRQMWFMQSLFVGSQVCILASSVLLVKYFVSAGYGGINGFAMWRPMGRAVLAEVFGSDQGCLWPTGWALLVCAATLFSICEVNTGCCEVTIGHKLYLVVHYVGIGNGLLMLVATGTRAGWLMLVGGVAYLAYRHQCHRRHMPLLVCSLVGFAIYAGVWDLLTETLGGRSFVQQSDFAAEMNERSDYWPLIIEKLGDSPVWGYGGLGVRSFFNGMDQAESQVLSTAFRYGMLGLGIFAALACGVANSAKQLKAGSSYDGALSVFLGGCLFGLFHEAIQIPTFGALWFFCAGVCLEGAGRINANSATSNLSDKSRQTCFASGD